MSVDNLVPNASSHDEMKQSAVSAVSIVVPCYFDEAAVPALFEALGPVMDGLGPSSQLVLVDDGSRDRTTEVAVELARGFQHRTTIVRLRRNFGQHAAVFAGFEHATGDVIVTLDSDLQYPPESIPALVAALDGPAKVATGYRVARRDPLARKLVSRVLTWWLGRSTGVRMRDYGSMFCAYDREVIDLLMQFSERRRYVPALVGWLGVPIVEVPVEHRPRPARGSRYRLGPLVDMFLDLVTGYALFPLRSVSLVGFAGATIGFFATLVFGLYRVVRGAGVSGLTSAMAVVFLLLGTQLLLLALVGEYVGRIYENVRDRPYYLVEDVVQTP